MVQNAKQMLLGPNSYPAIIGEIFEKIQNAQCQTLTGTEFLKDIYKNLNESITPALDLKEFVTKGEKVAGDDVTLKEIIDFTKKSMENVDLNFIINLCKEEHFKEMKRMSHPSPEQTIKDIKSSFDEPASVIEQGIRNGLFDGLKSKLLNKVKVDLGVIKPLNENNTTFNGSLIKYTPIGITFEDVQNNRKLLLLENDILSYDRVSKKLSKLNESIAIPDNYNKLMIAINSCGYNPETEIFSLNENWDFNLILNKDGKTKIKRLDSETWNEIPNEKVRDLLYESVNLYISAPGKVNNFNKYNFLQDADNFLALMENHSKLIQFDNLQVIKNLNESNYVLLNLDLVQNQSTPEILASTNGSKSFKTYANMMESCKEILNQDISNLFESQLITESEVFAERNSKIVSLNEEQKEINLNILKVQKLKTIAEENSPAMVKLNEQENILNNLLNENIKNLDFYINEF